MSVRISWSTSAQVSTGLEVKGAQAVGVGGHGYIVQDIAAKPVSESESSVDLEIQPSADADAVSFFALTSTRYAPELTFSVDGGTADIPIDAPIFLMGGSVNKLLGVTPQQITVENTGPDTAQITILVGRKAEA